MWLVLASAALAAPCDGDADSDPSPACGGADCDDANPRRSSLLPELCNGLDDDCDGLTDEGLRDLDGDGFPGAGQCGQRPAGPDCDDGDAQVWPRFNGEVPGNGLDDDCDGRLDEDDAFRDDDGDSYPEDLAPSEYGYGPVFESSCGPDADSDPARRPAAYLPDGDPPDGLDNACANAGVERAVDWDLDGLIGTDCDPRDPARFPGAPERHNGLDDDCDGLLPRSELDLVTAGPPLAEPDWDGDGASPAGGDCDDADAFVHPGRAEVCGDGIDQDCDGVDRTLDADADHDGWSSCRGDVDDDATRHPTAVEVCNGVDDDLDGAVDEGLDGDRDGWLACAGDCDDDDPEVTPDGVERCNGQVDDDCDGLLDEADPDAVPGAEDCDGGLDEDCDGAIDGVDPDCFAPPDPTGDTAGTGGSGAVATGLPRAWFCGSAPGEPLGWWLVAVGAWWRRRR